MTFRLTFTAALLALLFAVPAFAQSVDTTEVRFDHKAKNAISLYGDDVAAGDEEDVTSGSDEEMPTMKIQRDIYGLDDDDGTTDADDQLNFNFN